MARITELEKLQLENAALHKMLRRLEGYAAGGGAPTTRAVRLICEEAHTFLEEARRQKKGLKTPDLLEEHCKFIERVDARQYEAYVEDQDEVFGVGVGSNAEQAVKKLRELVESFMAYHKSSPSAAPSAS